MKLFFNSEENTEHELTQKIRQELSLKCSARSLDDKEDFEAVIQTIQDAVASWIENRCPGCR